ncbi:MAG: MFS transporter [Actinomycetota bacterium]|nr:MAG: MFS transporter [Actinomycetota bacterium]
MVHRRGRWIDGWDPENEQQWQAGGRRIAIRNLVLSVFAENLGFSVWLIWSAVVVSLPAAGFAFSVDQLFWLVSVPALVGAFARLPYTFAVTRFGGRNWTVVSALALLLPTIGLVACVLNPATPYLVFVLVAATAGLGGGNFASSMANINFFFPQRSKGFALGINAAGGNLGASTVQLLVPVVVGVGAFAVIGGAQAPGLYLQNAGLMWIPLIVLAAILAWRWMDNLSNARASVREQLSVTSDRHTWIMSFLYVGTFGSFMGFAGAFPLLIKTQFPAQASLNLAFLGALVGSLSRPVGGLMADRLGGARVTAVNFVVMGIAGVAAVVFVGRQSFAGFLASFLVLFASAGIGNGSTYRMIPSIFRFRALATAGDGAQRSAALAAATRSASAVVGFASAVGALGGFLIPQALRSSISATGGIAVAMVVFIGFYAVCVAVTWLCYLRRSATVGGGVV